MKVVSFFIGLSMSILLVNGQNNSDADFTNASKKPALRVRLTERGLAYAALLSRHILQDEIYNISLPRLEVDIRDGPGYGRVSLDKMDIQSFRAPHFRYQLAPPHGIAWKSTGGSVFVIGEWSSWYQMLFKIYLNGVIRIWATNIDLYLNASVFTTENGLPQINVSECSVHIEALSIDIKGGVIQWIVNLFHNDIAERIREAIHVHVCKAAQGVLLRRANRALSTLPSQVPLLDGLFYLNYALTSDPMATQNFIQGDAYAAFSSHPQLQNSSRDPGQPLPRPSGGSGRMIYFWASDFIANTFMQTAHNNNVLSVLIDKSLGRKVKAFLRTSCLFLCIGKAIPALHSRFPGRYVDVLIGTLQPPSIVIQPNNHSYFTAVLKADLYLSPWNVTRKLLFQAKINMNGTVFLEMRKRLVIGRVEMRQFSMAVTNSSVGEISPQAVHFMSSVFRPLIELLANALLERGIRVPTVEHVSLVRPQIFLMNRTVRIETDIVYKRHFHRRLIHLHAKT